MRLVNSYGFQAGDRKRDAAAQRGLVSRREWHAGGDHYGAPRVIPEGALHGSLSGDAESRSPFARAPAGMARLHPDASAAELQRRLSPQAQRGRLCCRTCRFSWVARSGSTRPRRRVVNDVERSASAGPSTAIRGSFRRSMSGSPGVQRGLSGAAFLLPSCGFDAGCWPIPGPPVKDMRLCCAKMLNWEPGRSPAHLSGGSDEAHFRHGSHLAGSCHHMGGPVGCAGHHSRYDPCQQTSRSRTTFWILPRLSPSVTIRSASSAASRRMTIPTCSRSR